MAAKKTSAFHVALNLELSLDRTQLNMALNGIIQGARLTKTVLGNTMDILNLEYDDDLCHLFKKVPTDEAYKLWVAYFGNKKVTNALVRNIYDLLQYDYPSFPGTTESNAAILNLLTTDLFWKDFFQKEAATISEVDAKRKKEEQAERKQSALDTLRRLGYSVTLIDTKLGEGLKAKAVTKPTPKAKVTKPKAKVSA